jgi:hypothetical protein
VKRLLPLLVACSHPVAREQPAAESQPRLVVLLVIDQLPQWAFVTKRPVFTGGFDRLLREGEWHTGEYPAPNTLTAPGHALLGSGQPTSATGILSNEWWDRDAQRMVASVEDPDGGVSATRLRVPGLGDAVAAANTGAKAVAVSLKDRAALLVLGHAGTAIWYEPKQIAFVGNHALPWLAAYQQAHPIAPHLEDVWTPMWPDRLGKLSTLPDDAPNEVGEKGFGKTFPHDLGATDDPAEAIEGSPIGNALVLDVALAAIAGEHLGEDKVPDLLVISLSVNDYVGHGWGHESWESWDEMLRLDFELAGFLQKLDTTVGTGKWALIATSDHGAAPMPASDHRMSYRQVKDAANAAAVAEFGPGEWVAAAKYPTVWLTPAALAQPERERNIAIKKIMFALRSFPGIERVERTADFAGHCETRTGDAFVLCQMLDPVRSGEILFLPRAGWIFGSGDPQATAHGSIHDYDRHVPVIMLPPNRVAHAPLAKPSETTVRMIRISTVVARWLGVTPPVSLRSQ